MPPSPALLLAMQLAMLPLMVPVPAQQQSSPAPAGDHTSTTDEEGHNSSTTAFAFLLQNATEANKCDGNDDGDCKHSVNASAATASPYKLRSKQDGTPKGPLLYGLSARSLSISALDFAENSTAEAYYEANNILAVPLNHELKYRVFAQSWCSAAGCPMALAATGSDINVGGLGSGQDTSTGKGEAVLVAKGVTYFGAVAVSILERTGSYGVCAHAVSTAMPDTSCAVVCWHGNLTCTCSSICTKAEVGSDSVLAYRYAVNPDTGLKELLSFLHLLMVRFHGITDRINNLSVNLNIPFRSLMIRERIEKRFGPEKAKVIPVISA